MSTRETEYTPEGYPKIEEFRRRCADFLEKNRAQEEQVRKFFVQAAAKLRAQQGKTQR